MDDDLDRLEANLRIQRGFINVALAKVKLSRSARSAARSWDRFGMACAASEIRSADIGDFDNRAHDWLRSE